MEKEEKKNLLSSCHDPLPKYIYISKLSLRYVKIHLKNCMLDDTWHKNKDGRGPGTVEWHAGDCEAK